MTSQSSYRWQLPEAGSTVRDKQKLAILNSFTRKKEIFVPVQNKTIKWYSCGPTVYDVSHLGHARCYITFDIIRRILVDYFGFQVFYVMNITDIDDKIIKRARSNHLCDLFISKCLESTTSHEQIVAQIIQAIDNFKSKRKDETDPAKIKMNNTVIKNSLQNLDNLQKLSSTDQEYKQQLDVSLQSLRDVIADFQDDMFADTVSDNKIFKPLTEKFEQEFHLDMQKLDVLPPSALTRVSEYIDEVGLFIKKLESNGYAYRAGGSVYFDTEKFEADPKHSYAKLVREAFGHKKSLDEGEGELSVGHHDTKKSPSDFALWKASKIGEPSWTTQDYDPGRPGWHIECSVMASHLLGHNFDIHSGGCDLKFPHHDNEIAQAEAYYDTGKDWVNYFIHSGHLSISGCKMSKSLKNFITIRQALNDYSSRQLRFAFLAHSWAETLDYSPNTMNTATSYEKTFREFFLNVVDTLRRSTGVALDSDNKDNLTRLYNKWSDDDKVLNQEYMDAVNKVDAAICDNFDTRSVLNVLSALVKETNKRPQANLILLKEIATYIRKILSIFGANFTEADFDKFFNPNNQEKSQSNIKSSDEHETAYKYLEVLAQFRSDIRKTSNSSDPQSSMKQILALCDRLRDDTLPDLGVRLEDKEVAGRSFVVKLVDPETMAREKAQAERLEQEKRLKQERNNLEKLKLQKEREDKMKIPPSEMFKGQTDKYSQFDDEGMPTHDAAGKEISKSALKKLQRLYAEQKARYNKYLGEK